MAGDLALGTVEGREVGKVQGFPTAQLLAELGGRPGVVPVVGRLAPALAIHCVPHVPEVDLQLALAPRVGAS